MDVNDYFRSETNRRLESIETKIDQLLQFRAKILADSRWISAITGAVVSLVIALAAAWMGH